jgi:hypothetical protein
MLNSMDNLETIRERLAKLDRVIECQGSTDGEKDSARARRAEILERYNLTEETVRSSFIGPHVFILERTRWGRQLWLQCAAWMLQVSPVAVLRLNRVEACMNVTPLDAADLRACYCYYAAVMYHELDKIDGALKSDAIELEERIKLLQKALDKRRAQAIETKAKLLDSLILRYKLRGPRIIDETKSAKVSDKELEDFLKHKRLADQMDGDAWQRGEKVGDSEHIFKLTN